MPSNQVSQIQPDFSEIEAARERRKHEQHVLAIAAGSSRFHRAAMDGYVDMLCQASRRDTNAANELTGLTPTHLAAHLGRLEALRILVGRGGDPEQADASGSSCLHLAAAQNQTACVAFLVNFGVNLWLLDNDLHTAKDLAAIQQRKEALELLDGAMARQSAVSTKQVQKLKEKAKIAAEKRLKRLRKSQLRALKRAERDERQLAKLSNSRPLIRAAHSISDIQLVAATGRQEDSPVASGPLGQLSRRNSANKISINNNVCLGFGGSMGSLATQTTSGHSIANQLRSKFHKLTIAKQATNSRMVDTRPTGSRILGSLSSGSTSTSTNSCRWGIPFGGVSNQTKVKQQQQQQPTRHRPSYSELVGVAHDQNKLRAWLAGSSGSSSSSSSSTSSSSKSTSTSTFTSSSGLSTSTSSEQSSLNGSQSVASWSALPMGEKRTNNKTGVSRKVQLRNLFPLGRHQHQQHQRQQVQWNQNVANPMPIVQPPPPPPLPVAKTLQGAERQEGHRQLNCNGGLDDMTNCNTNNDVKSSENNAKLKRSEKIVEKSAQKQNSQSERSWTRMEGKPESRSSRDTSLKFERSPIEEEEEEEEEDEEDKDRQQQQQQTATFNTTTTNINNNTQQELLTQCLSQLKLRHEAMIMKGTKNGRPNSGSLEMDKLQLFNSSNELLRHQKSAGSNGLKPSLIKRHARCLMGNCGPETSKHTPSSSDSIGSATSFVQRNMTIYCESSSSAVSPARSTECSSSSSTVEVAQPTSELATTTNYQQVPEDVEIEPFLRSHGLLDLLEVFVREQIDLEALVLLNEADLRSLDIVLGPRRKLLKAIEERRGQTSQRLVMVDTQL